MFAANLITRQTACVELWHQRPQLIDGWTPNLSVIALMPAPADVRKAADIPAALGEPVLANHALNFQLWHEEDLARDPAADDAVIAGVKRRIDRLNQQRNDAIEEIDAALASVLEEGGVRPAPDAGFATETPGAAIDRLSILALRIYHYQERSRAEAGDSPLAQRLRESLNRCLQQQERLKHALDALIADIFAGRRRHDVFRQLKMYNDPELNPKMRSSPPNARGE